MIKQISKNKYRLIISQGSGASRRKFTKTVTFDGGKKALRKLYDEFEAEVLSSAPTSDITIGELLNSYIDHIRTLNRKHTTIHGYEVAVKRFQSRFKAIKAKECNTSY